MNNLLSSWSPTSLALLLAALTMGILLVMFGLGASNPLIRRMGLRNVVRRPGQTLMMLMGLTLATIFITASFGLQESFNQSMVSDRLLKMGNVDEAVSGTFTQAQVNEALAHLRQMPQVQAATGILYLPNGASILSERTALNNIDQYVYGVPPAFDQVYGPLFDNQGHQVHFADLGPHDVFVSSTVARDEGVRAGDRLQLVFEEQTNETLEVTVRAVLSHDLAVTDGELEFNGSYPEIIMPLATALTLGAQTHFGVLMPNVLCVKNVGSGGLDDIGPDGRRGQPVLDYLAQFFHAAPDTRGFFPTYFDSAILHPLKPDVAESQGNFSPLDNKSDYDASPAARQFSLMLPVFTALLVGAGLLLQALLCLLLAAERRAELGMGRAIGLQRSHLVQVLLIEGCGYAIIASTLGLLLGLGAVVLELALLSQVPAAGVLSSHITLHLAVSWQSLLSSWCGSVLVILAVVFITATWISRMNIVAAIRDLDESISTLVPFRARLRSLWMSPRDAEGQPLPETFARRFSRKTAALGQLLWEGFRRGPVCLLLGGMLFKLTSTQGGSWMQQLSVALLLMGGGLLVSWLMMMLKAPGTLARRLGLSLVGLGWLVYGIWTGKNLLLIIFTSDVSALGSHVYIDASPPDVLVGLFLPLFGTVLLVMSNLDLLGALLTFLFRRVRGLAPISRTGLAYPLTFRFRNGVTVTLLCLIVFLVVLVVSNNLSSIQQTASQTTTGNFQLEIVGEELDLFDSALNAQLLATPQTLRQEIALVTRMRFAYDPHHAQPIRLSLPGHPVYTYTKAPGPLVVDNTFLSNTTMPLFARARGYDSDRQVWDTVRDQPGYAVLQYVGNDGLPTNQGFAPFTAEIPQTGDPHAPYRQVTVIGLLPSNAYWGTMFFSEKTETSLGATPYSRFPFYYFRIQSEGDLAQAATALNNAFQLNRRGLVLNSLVQDSLNAYTASLTLFLAIYLVMGLLFGAFSLGVITSRAVVERRQQIGMLRALGFSRGLVQRSFLLEASFVITLSELSGSLLAWWLASQITVPAGQAFSFPYSTIVPLFVGSYLVALLCTLLPARKASRIPPAEALRYE
ncbi:MAG TPA: FtsX-like permease family protein [Ktedonobacteraceae bacterium]|nr:FtsX-like permease family protein [Ktedonobacteraceae bacterium]